jgi:inosose dehydratase
MTIKIGTAPVSWGIMEIEGWGEQQPFGSVLDEMQQAGYSGTELGPYDYFPTDPNALTAELSARGLDLVAAFVPIRWRMPRDTRPDSMRPSERRIFWRQVVRQ